MYFINFSIFPYIKFPDLLTFWYMLDNFIYCMHTARMVWWIGAGEGLAGWYYRIALAGIPHRPSVSTARSCGCSVVETMGFARIVIAAGPKSKNILLFTLLHTEYLLIELPRWLIGLYIVRLQTVRLESLFYLK